jgi:hypothetical protein
MDVVVGVAAAVVLAVVLVAAAKHQMRSGSPDLSL